jgi:hypothetical protein
MLTSQPESPQSKNIVAEKWLEIYKEVCADIRTTDEISFKLLGLVPTFAATAAGALTLLEKSPLLGLASPWVVLTLAVAGSVITYGLFRWELRNIQKCQWLIERAADLERFALAGGVELPKQIQYLNWSGNPKPHLPTFKGLQWGKTESEAVVYLAALAVWLVPAALAVSSLF